VILLRQNTSLSAGTASANLVKKDTLPSGSSARAIPAGVYVFWLLSISVFISMFVS